jgi:type I restriction enzyme S subunit
MLRTTNVRGGFVDTENVRFVTLETYERWTRRLVPERGDVFLTREAPLGDVGRLTSDDKVFLGQRLFHYRADPNFIDARFLAYVLQSPSVQGWIKGVGSGATVEHARVGDFHKIPIPVPPLGVQARMGDILSAYDDLTENNRRRITLLEETARMLYREWFVYFRFPGHEHVQISDGIPDGWMRKSVGDACIFLGRGISPTYNDDGEYIVVSQKCVRDRLLSLAPARRQSKEYKAEKALRYLDVLINSTGTGTLGRVAQCWIEPEATTFDSHVTVARANDTVDPFWFGYAMLELQSIFEGMGEGATNQKELSKNRIAEVRIVSPPRPLQVLFADFAAKTAAQIQTLSNQNEKLAQARDLLLPRLMNAEIAV